jgi:hypothetical protein
MPAIPGAAKVPPSELLAAVGFPGAVLYLEEKRSLTGPPPGRGRRGLSCRLRSRRHRENTRPELDLRRPPAVAPVSRRHSWNVPTVDFLDIP